MTFEAFSLSGDRPARAAKRLTSIGRSCGRLAVIAALLFGGAVACSGVDLWDGSGSQSSGDQPIEKAKPLSASELAEIADLLKQAERLAAAGRVMEPAGDSALDKYRAVLAIDPVNPVARSEVAALAAGYREESIAASEAGRYQDALAYARQAEAIEPENSDNLDLIAIAHAGLGQWEEAIAANRRSIELGSQTGAEKRLAGNYFSLERYGLAAAILEKVVQAQPDDIQAYRLLGLSRQRMGQLPRAEQAFFRAYELAGEEEKPDHALDLGRVYLAMGNYSLAATFLEEAADTHFGDRQVYEDLAIVHRKLGNDGRWLEVISMRAMLKVMGDDVSFRPVAAVRADGIRELVQQHFASAVLSYLLEAGERGDAESAYLMARVYHRGYGEVAKDLNQARFWYMESGRRGHAGGQTGVGHMYYNGLGGLPRDPARAAEWFKRAADQNQPGAMARLGLMYERGTGVPRNTKTASYYLVLAADAGDPMARQRLTELGVWPLQSGVSKASVPTITGGIGELPPLTVMTGNGPIVVTDRATGAAEKDRTAGAEGGRPAGKKRNCSGLMALECAFE
ncbi:MAG: hypothetical protein QNJ67_19350 [Kiloniellales bacterium]|nr:hypothetical protein [Kiloniellales bacterium]